MRLVVFFLVLLTAVCTGCGLGADREKAQTYKEVNTPADNTPVDLGDQNTAVGFRVLRDAKEAKKQIESRRQEAAPLIEDTE